MDIISSYRFSSSSVSIFNNVFSIQLYWYQINTYLSGFAVLNILFKNICFEKLKLNIVCLKQNETDCLKHVFLCYMFKNVFYKFF